MRLSGNGHSERSEESFWHRITFSKQILSGKSHFREIVTLHDVILPAAFPTIFQDCFVNLHPA
jgi:hypothetical protein